MATTMDRRDTKDARFIVFYICYIHAIFKQENVLFHLACQRLNNSSNVFSVYVYERWQAEESLVQVAAIDVAKCAVESAQISLSINHEHIISFDVEGAGKVLRDEWRAGSI